jgi:hypothetical protein
VSSYRFCALSLVVNNTLHQKKAISLHSRVHTASRAPPSLMCLCYFFFLLLFLFRSYTQSNLTPLIRFPSLATRLTDPFDNHQKTSQSEAEKSMGKRENWIFIFHWIYRREMDARRHRQWQVATFIDSHKIIWKRGLYSTSTNTVTIGTTRNLSAHVLEMWWISHPVPFQIGGC